MARPALRTPQGRWSLNQVATDAEITYRQARTLVGLGHLSSDSLTGDDVLVAKVAAALLDGPRPPGLNRVAATDITHARDKQGLDLARRLWAEPDSGEATLMVLPHTVQVAYQAYDLMGFLAANQGHSLLILPIGHWITNLRRSAS